MKLIKRILKFIKIFSFSKNYFTSSVLSRMLGSNNIDILNKIKVIDGCLSLNGSNISVPISKMEILNNDLQLLIILSNHFSISNHENGLLFVSTNGYSPIKIIVRIQDNVGVLTETFLKHAYFFTGNETFTVIDVGMNVGIPTLFFASLPWVKEVYGYELVPNTFDWANQNFLLNPILNDKIFAFSHGLAADDNELLIPEAYDGAVGASATDFVVQQQNVQYPWNTGKTKVTVRNAETVIRNIINRSKNRIVLKLDCEGAEYEIIELLSRKKLLQNISILMIEWHLRGPQIIIDILNENGFTLFSFEEEGSFSCGFIYCVGQSHSDY